MGHVTISRVEEYSAQGCGPGCATIYACAPVRSAQGANPSADPPGDLEQLNLRALKMAVQDLTQSFPDQYRQGKEYLRAAADFEQRLPEIRAGLRAVLFAVRPDSDTAAIQLT
ncbi:MAG: hypothetical protein M1376_00525 [Planctomycetes bacterium]|nr:hypothetical protein [Planctomycetota bacterium]